ncbi:MAG: deoxynucleoside kinase [Candidatus Aenigmarchaeota archaeon]|nr:deoxynucleoside kinase [Candidatus Aenigmarchaeota archaeon]
MQKIVYFCGTHGSGKSTLVKMLASDTNHFVERGEINLPRQANVSERNFARLCRMYLYALQEREFAKEFPEKYVLGDRRVLDHLAYTAGFAKLGWCSESVKTSLHAVAEILFVPDHWPQNVVFVRPSLDFTISCLQKRWAETGKKKWNEDNFDYLRAVYCGYDEVMQHFSGNVQLIQETDLNERVKKVYAWLGISTSSQTTHKQ